MDTAGRRVIFKSVRTVEDADEYIKNDGKLLSVGLNEEFTKNSLHSNSNNRSAIYERLGSPTHSKFSVKNRLGPLTCEGKAQIKDARNSKNKPVTTFSSFETESYLTSKSLDDLEVQNGKIRIKDHKSYQRFSKEHFLPRSHVQNIEDFDGMRINTLPEIKTKEMHSQQSKSSKLLFKKSVSLSQMKRSISPIRFNCTSLDNGLKSFNCDERLPKRLKRSFDSIQLPLKNISIKERLGKKLHSNFPL